jgi:hypothetical protein
MVHNKSLKEHEMSFLKGFVHTLGSKSARVTQTDEDTVAVTLRFSPRTKERLAAYAEAGRTSMNAVGSILIEHALDQLDQLVIEEEERLAKEAEASADVDEMIEKKRADEEKALGIIKGWKEAR